MWFELIERLAQTLPSQCAICHRWPQRTVCDECVARFVRLEPRCRRCAIAVPTGQDHCGQCLRTPPPLDRCLAAVSYAYPWSHCIARFKFGAQPGWATSLALLMRSTPWVEPALERADWVLPMPLSVQRLTARGFNPALELARRLAPGKTRTDVLLRIRDTPSQARLDRQQRMRNVVGAFALQPQLAQEMRDRKLVLIDDVMTSGATLHASARVLRQAGASDVTAIVLARTEVPP